MFSVSATSATVRNLGAMPAVWHAGPGARLCPQTAHAAAGGPAGWASGGAGPAVPRRHVGASGGRRRATRTRRGMDLLEVPAPVAARLRRPGWRDPRLLSGVALVAGAVALGSWVVSSAQHTVPVYVARGAL